MKSWRPVIFLSLVFICAAVIVGRLFYIQVWEHKFYQAQALGEQSGFNEVQGQRGEIFFDNSKESQGEYGSGDIKSLAINKDTYLLSVVPNKIKDQSGLADLLSKNIGESPETILSKLQSSASYVIIKKNLSDQEVSSLKSININGVNLENSPGRYYPEGSMAAQTIGFVGGQSEGQYGIEGYYNTVLEGKEGIEENEKGLNVINGPGQQDLDGSDLYLTIDYNIQFQAEQLLLQEKQKDDIDSGQIIVMKPDTGAILAMANYPSFDLNDYSQQTDLGIFQNTNIQKLFEPGSVFKAFTMAIALQEGAVTPATTFVDTGSVKFGPATIYNFDHAVYGLSDMSKILEKSINTGAVFLSNLIPHSTFLAYVNKLGFDQKTGIDLQGEVTSDNSVLENGPPVEFATAAFGQGIDMTPIQLIQAYDIFANNGKMAKPYVVEKIVHGQDQQVTQPQISSQIFSTQTISEVNQMLINVVERGFGDGAHIPGYYLAGKTGTAQVPIPGQNGYYPSETIQSFVGYGPAYNPKFLILVKLDNPKVPESALSAVPLFKQLSQYIINYWQIPPDYTGPDPTPK